MAKSNRVLMLLKKVAKIIGGLVLGYVLIIGISIIWPTMLGDATYDELVAMTAAPKQVRLLAYRNANDRTVIGSADLSQEESKKMADLLRSGRIFFPGGIRPKCLDLSYAIEFVQINGTSDRVLIDRHCDYFRTENGPVENLPLPWQDPIKASFRDHNLPLVRID